MYSDESAMSENRLRVGNRGEIYTTKELRKALGIKKGSRVKAELQGDALVIRKVTNLEELLERPKLASIGVEELRNSAFDSRELQLRRNGYVDC